MSVEKMNAYHVTCSVCGYPADTIAKDEADAVARLGWQARPKTKTDSFPCVCITCLAPPQEKAEP